MAASNLRLDSTTDESLNNRLRVSVIVPTHNYGALIGETLNSLQRQTLTDWECIVVDDGSTDNTAEVMARVMERDSRIHYLRQENQRQAVAKNTGVSEARGEYVQFLDADDLLEPRKFELQVEFLESHPEVDIVYGSARYFTTEKPGELLTTMFGDAKPWMPKASGQDKQILSPLMVGNIMVINAPLVRRSLIAEVGGFDAVLPPVEDWDYWIRCALRGARFEFRDFAGALALVRSHAASSSKQTEAMRASVRRLRQRIGTLTREPELLRLNRECWSQAEAELAVLNMAEHHRVRAMRQFLKAARISPRAKARAKLLLCGLVSAFASERQVRRIITLRFPSASVNTYTATTRD